MFFKKSNQIKALQYEIYELNRRITKLYGNVDLLQETEAKSKKAHKIELTQMRNALTNFSKGSKNLSYKIDSYKSQVMKRANS